MERRNNLRRHEDRNHKFLGFITLTVLLASIVSFSFGYYTAAKQASEYVTSNK